LKSLLTLLICLNLVLFELLNCFLHSNEVCLILLMKRIFFLFHISHFSLESARKLILQGLNFSLCNCSHVKQTNLELSDLLGQLYQVLLVWALLKWLEVDWMWASFIGCTVGITLVLLDWYFIDTLGNIICWSISLNRWK
jgi:hypothetical protein